MRLIMFGHISLSSLNKATLTFSLYILSRWLPLYFNFNIKFLISCNFILEYSAGDKIISHLPGTEGRPQLSPRKGTAAFLGEL